MTQPGYNIVNEKTGQTIGSVPAGYVPDVPHTSNAPAQGPMFDDTLYDPSTDPTVSNWGGSAYDRAESNITHNLDTSVPGGAFASVRAPGWHNLGTVHTKQVSALELLQSAYGDYEVFKAADFAHVERPWLGENGEQIMLGDQPQTTIVQVEDTAKRKLCRIHPTTGQVQVLGTCSPTYQPINNREAFVGFGDALIDVAEPNVSTCGVLYEGKQAFMCWKLPRGIEVGGVDAVEWWLLVHTSHDLSAALTAAIVPLRTVCANTCTWNLARAKSRWSIKHTANAKLNLSEAREALKLSYTYADEWARVSDELIKVPMMPRVFEQIIEHNFGPGEDAKPKAQENWDVKRAKLVRLFAEADTQANVRNTAYAGVQAVGEYCDWMTGVQAKTVSKDGWGGNVDGYRFWRSLEGEKTVARPKQAALAAIAAYAGVALADA